jgi:hypothetical protein
MLRSIYNIFPVNIKIMLYYFMIYSYLHYAICAWGNAYDVHVKLLIILHKRTIRLVTNASWLDHCKPLAYDYSLLMLPEIYLYKCVLTTYRYLFYFDALLLTQLLSLSYGSRHPFMLSVPYCRTTLRKRSSVLSCIAVWNNLPIDLRSVRSFTSLKQLYKIYLVNHYVY